MRFAFQVLALTAAATRASASCAHGTFLHPREATGEGVEVATFGYTGTNGPLLWAALDFPANKLCATGTKQSPINMVDGVFDVVPGSDVQITVNDMPDGAVFENLGTTVEVVTQGGTLVVDEKQFELQQFHFHLPSEHLDNGTSHAMEMHMVWQSAAEEIAVVGVYIDMVEDDAAVAAPPQAEKRALSSGSRFPRQQEYEQPQQTAIGGPTALLETLFSVVDEIATPGSTVRTPPLNMSEVVDILTTHAFQVYTGSLTTPPCTEGVSWHVSTARLAVTPDTFARARDVIGFNARYPQNTPGEPNLLMLSALSIAAAALADNAEGKLEF